MVGLEFLTIEGMIKVSGGPVLRADRPTSVAGQRLSHLTTRRDRVADEPAPWLSAAARKTRMKSEQLVEYGVPIDSRTMVTPPDVTELELEPGHPGLGDGIQNLQAGLVPDSTVPNTCNG